MIRLMESPPDFIGPVNIGNPGEFTMLELAELIQETVGTKVNIQFLPLPQDDPRQRKPDISLARSKLDWEPKISLEDGLKETVAYFRKTL